MYETTNALRLLDTYFLFCSTLYNKSTLCAYSFSNKLLRKFRNNGCLGFISLFCRFKANFPTNFVLLERQSIVPVGSAPGERARLRNAYESLLIEEPVFVHPNSSLALSALRSRSRSADAAPEFLLFMELNETSKVYMRCAYIHFVSYTRVIQY